MRSPFVANWRLTRVDAVFDQVPGVRIPMNGFMGTVGVLPGEPEVQAWLARETARSVPPAARRCRRNL